MHSKLEVLISVIVPVYKVEKYLSTCIDSIISQTYRNLEIILVADDSQDRCPEICDKYLELDSRVKVIHKKNEGLSSARNAGLKIAKGEYITFVDSDDYISKDMIKVLYDICFNYHVLLSQCNFIRDGRFEDINVNNIKVNILSKNQCFLNLFDTDGMAFCASWGKLYHKSLFENIFFPYGKSHEDIYTSHQFFEKAGKIGYIPNGLYYYRQRNDSLMAEEKRKPSLEEVKANMVRGNYLRKNGYLEAYKVQLWVCIKMLRQKYCGYYEGWSIEEKKHICREYRKLLLKVKKIQRERLKMNDWLFYFTPDMYCIIEKFKQFILFN